MHMRTFCVEPYSHQLSDTTAAPTGVLTGLASWHQTEHEHVGANAARGLMVAAWHLNAPLSSLPSMAGLTYCRRRSVQLLQRESASSRLWPEDVVVEAESTGE